MKKLYYKTCAIIRSPLVVEDDTELYNYVIKKNHGTLMGDTSGLDFRIGDYSYNSSLFFRECMRWTGEKNYEYYTIEQKDFNVIDISNKIKPNDAATILQKYPDILKDIIMMEATMRLLFDIPVIFREILIYLYDEHKNSQGRISFLRNNNYAVQSYGAFNSDRFLNNARLKIDKDIIFNANERAMRAISFYASSYESENPSIRFALIVASIECLFYTKDSENVYKKISNLSSYLLFSNDEHKRDEACTEIRHLYNKRSRFLHGNINSDINIEDELCLRGYARRIILSYIMYAYYSKKKSTQIIKSLLAEEKIPIQTRLFITAVNADSFGQQQLDLIKEVEKEYGIKIPDREKEKILNEIIR